MDYFEKYILAATRPAPATKGPLTPTRSEMKAHITIEMKQRTYGGADKPFD